MGYKITAKDVRELSGKPITWEYEDGTKDTTAEAFVVISQEKNAWSIKPLDPDKVKADIRAGKTRSWLYEPTHPKFCFWTGSGESTNLAKEIAVAKRLTRMGINDLVDTRLFGNSVGCAIY